jgi:hypothetical protein
MVENLASRPASGGCEIISLLKLSNPLKLLSQIIHINEAK